MATTLESGDTNAHRPPARSFQAEATRWLQEVERGILGDDPGTGKSRPAIEAAHEPVAIFGPSALEGNWADEVALWRPDLAYQYIPYTQLCRRVADTKGRMSKAIGVPKAELKGPWRTVIADEAHYLKGRGTNWVEAFEKLDYDNLYMLTGTPVPNWAHEIYMLVKLIRPAGVDINSFWRWAERWFNIWEHSWQKGGKGPKTKNVGTLKACTPLCRNLPLGDVCAHWVEFIVGNGLDVHMLRRTREEVLPELPPLIEQTIECPMVPAQRRAYEELKKNYLTWVDGVGEISAWSDGSKYAKLHQVTTGLETLAEGGKGSGKLDMLAELLADRGASPTLVGVQYRDTAAAVVALCGRMKRSVGVIQGGMKQSDLDDLKRTFQKGRLPVLVGTLEKLAEGHNLHRADTAIQVERSWKTYKNDQFKRRIHRMGQERTCHHITLITPNSVDDDVTDTLLSKTEQQVKTMRAQEFARLLREAG